MKCERVRAAICVFIVSQPHADFAIFQISPESWRIALMPVVDDDL
jgi:hypothetical protein